MEIKPIRRPWQKPSSSYGTRKSINPFYQSTAWDTTRELHKQRYTQINGFKLSHTYCIHCYKEARTLIPMHTVDHIIAIEDGGSPTDPTNLQSLCLSHHNRKSATEGNKRRKT